MVAKLSNSGFFGPHVQPNLGPEARPAAATLNQAGGPQVEAPEPNEAPAGLGGPQRNPVDVGPSARDPSSNRAGTLPPPRQNQPSVGASPLETAAGGGGLPAQETDKISYS